MGRARIYDNPADKQAAYRRRQAGAVTGLEAEVFEASVWRLRELVEAAAVPAGMKTNLLALVDAVSNREGYRQWQIERQRRG